MPLLQYVCKKCDKNFEELVKKYDDPIICPVCGGQAERSFCGRMYSATGTATQKCSGHCANCRGCK